MKKLLLLVALVWLISCVSAGSYNFQNPGDYGEMSYNTSPGHGTGYLTWYESPTAGNNYVKVYHQLGNYYTVMAPVVAEQTSYAGVTVVGYGGETTDLRIAAVVYDGTGTAVDVLSNTSLAWRGGGLLGRWEVKVDGGYAYLTRDGVFVDKSVALAANPYNIGFGPYPVIGADTLCYLSVDDLVYGQSENMYTANLPESEAGDNQIVLYKDITNSATHGTAFSANFSIINSNTLYGSWSRGNVSEIPPSISTLPNETIQFVNYGTGKVIAENSTGTSYYGNIALNVKTLLFDAGEPQGFYALYWPGKAKYSNIMEYRSNGATVNWASKSYSVGDTGAVIYFVLDGGYWSTSYSYKMAITDVYGNFYTNTTIRDQTGTITQEWTNDGTYDPGVYYAWLIATKSDGTEYILGGDYTTLYDYARLYGWVMEDKTGNGISGAFINCTYDSSWENTTSSATGNYTTTSVFISGTTPGCNVSATGYQTYWWNASLLSGSSKLVNFTLQSDTHSNTGTALGGVDRDNLYKNPIPSKVIQVVNVSNSENHYTTTNIAGWWMVDSLTAGRYYCATGFKTGYTNTTSCMTVV